MSSPRQPPAEPAEKIGVLGGGQIGRMFAEVCNRNGVTVYFLDAENSPAKQITASAEHINGSFADADSVKRLAESCDVLTVEIEHVNVDALDTVANTVRIEPSPKTLRIIQDKFKQKDHLTAHGVPVAEYRNLAQNSREELESIGRIFGYPLMLKSKTQAYDGRGNFPIIRQSDIPEALRKLQDRPLYAEKWAPFFKELAVMVVKTKHKVLSFPVVETIHEDSICKLVYAPARNVSSTVIVNAQKLACKAVETFEGRGVFGVEMFLLDDGELFINEIAPRPHNSGHYTIEACPISQYEAHRRAIVDEPLPEIGLRLREPAILLNVLGGKGPQSHLDLTNEAKKVGNASIHLYGKGDARPGRKMGHITVTAPSMRDAESAIQPLIECANRIRRERTDVAPPKKTTSKELAANSNFAVGVIMGSDSDKPTLNPGLELLENFEVSFETRIVSAHRTPQEMVEYARDASSRGIQVIIAAAGGAAHLPGMTAACTILPVIGVPVKGSTFDGQDSLLSIVQMPRGVPVATVGVNNSINAALLAARIIALQDWRVRDKLEQYQGSAKQQVKQKDKVLLEKGWRGYSN